MTRVVRVLSIDGGGIRGIIPAIVLAALERQSGFPAHRLFDLVAGTSTGAILAGGLAKPNPLSAQDLANAYISKGGDIFAASPWRNFGSIIAQGKYNPAPLEQMLDEYLGNVYLSECHPYVLIPTYDLVNREAKFFKSWRAQGILTPAGEKSSDADFRLKDIVRAATAAPTYFEPARVTNRSGNSFACIDGAVFANNPSMCALASVKKLWPDATSVILVSLGVGEFRTAIRYEDARGWGALAWARPVIDCMMDGTADTVDYQLTESFGKELQYFRLQIRLGGQDDPNAPTDCIDDASQQNIRKLILRGQMLAEQRAADIAILADLLNPMRQP